MHSSIVKFSFKIKQFYYFLFSCHLVQLSHKKSPSRSWGRREGKFSSWVCLVVASHHNGSRQKFPRPRLTADSQNPLHDRLTADPQNPLRDRLFVDPQEPLRDRLHQMIDMLRVVAQFQR